MDNMEIISWNVNGLRAVYKKGALSWLFERSPDIFCFQEVKADYEDIPVDIREIPDYYSYFSSSKNKKGYSGVATYTKIKPEKVEYGIGSKRFDDEGRIVEIFIKDIVLLNIYFPNGGGGPERLAYKLDFYDAFLYHIEKRRREGYGVIFCGDVNTAHEEIDLARPRENQKNTGFLPEERAWIDEVINKGYVDVYRHFHPEKKEAYTYWDMKSFARERNVGWRIDYFFISPDLLRKVKKVSILNTIFGSDHCPILLELK